MTRLQTRNRAAAAAIGCGLSLCLLYVGEATADSGEVEVTGQSSYIAVGELGAGPLDEISSDQIPIGQWTDVPNWTMPYKAPGVGVSRVLLDVRSSDFLNLWCVLDALPVEPQEPSEICSFRLTTDGVPWASDPPSSTVGIAPFTSASVQWRAAVRLRPKTFLASPVISGGSGEVRLQVRLTRPAWASTPGSFTGSGRIDVDTAQGPFADSVSTIYRLDVVTEGGLPPVEVSEFWGGPWSSLLSAFLLFGLLESFRRFRATSRSLNISSP
jgi:hypothetical protein